jgi:hypothetical protein
VVSFNAVDALEMTDIPLFSPADADQACRPDANLDARRTAMTFPAILNNRSGHDRPAGTAEFCMTQLTV